MNYCIKCGDHPYDALNAVNSQLALIATLVRQASTDPSFSLDDKALTGLFWFLREAEEITSAVLAHYKEV
ncbi:MAG TPA: hypothetical protein VF795_11715 [Desulfuromonadaceae bacterium]